MNTADLKLELIKIISDLKGDWKLKWLLKVSKLLKLTPSKKAFSPPPVIPTKKEETEEERIEKLLELGRKPTPDHIPLEQLIKEQNYDPKNIVETLKNWDYSLFDDDPTVEEILKMKI